VLEDYTRAPIDERLRAVLSLLEKMTLDHSALCTEDVREVLAKNVSKEAIADALEVAFLFNVYDRLADTMGWHVPAKETGYYSAAAKRLLKQGYV